jgi:DNA-binding SARP family transcriptional activator
LDDQHEESVISAPKVELLFATLAIRANQVVSLHQLTTEIWGDDPPRRANAALHVYISQLRKFLQPPGGPATIVTRAPGYLLRTTGEQDFTAFDRLLTSGRALLAEGRHAEAEADLTAALELWRGPALGDAQGNGPVIRGFAAWAEAARLALGAHRMVIGELYRLISEHPLREAFYRQLMLALYQADLQADALRVYQSARAVLASELGVEPCRRLRNLHQQILLGDQTQLDLAS